MCELKDAMERERIEKIKSKSMHGFPQTTNQTLLHLINYSCARNLCVKNKVACGARLLNLQYGESQRLL